MAVSCWISLASRSAIPVPCPDRNPCSTSLNVIAAVIRRFMRLAIVLQSTSTSPTPLNSLLFHLWIRTTVFHVLYLDRVPTWNAFFTMSTTFFQLVASGVLSQVAEISHWRRCSALISDRLTKCFRQSLRTAQAISFSSGMESSTRNGCTST